MVGVLIKKHKNSSGHKPSTRSFSGVAVTSQGRFGMYGGASSAVFNDLRYLDADSMDWCTVM